MILAAAPRCVELDFLKALKAKREIVKEIPSRLTKLVAFVVATYFAKFFVHLDHPQTVTALKWPRWPWKAN